jgi:carbon-monoxide dehydrogenase small subunit
MVSMHRSISITVNGIQRELLVEPADRLIDVLRDDLDLTSVKEGCDRLGECGTCTVIMNGNAVLSCLVLAVDADGANVVTVEGLSDGEHLHPVQDSFVEHGAIQCGFCTPGMIMTTKDLLDNNPHPTEQEVREGIKGNLCRCTGYAKIVEAVLAAASEK